MISGYGSGSALGLSGAAFPLLRDLVQEKLGIYFDDKRSDVMGEKLGSLVVGRGFDSFLDYYYLLKYGDDAESEWRRVMDALSVQETYFWRESDQITCIAEKIVPDHFRNYPGRPLRIWSAACATGEEPLSIAMALDRSGWLRREPIEIVASDASDSALEKARRGVYRERSFRSIPADLWHRYFSPTDKGWAVDPELKERVQFYRANVSEENETALLAASDIIFCRNMFIYFSVAAIRRTVSSFARRMRRPGYLFVGSSESLINITDELRLDQINGAFVYVNNKE